MNIMMSHFLKNGLKFIAFTFFTLIAACGSKDMESRLELVKKSVAYDMKDPGSADFRNLKISNNTVVRKAVVCGEVNSKNSFGAYVGFRRFIADYDSNYILEGDALKGPPDALKQKVPLDSTPLNQSDFESARSIAASNIKTEIYRARTAELREALSRGDVYSNTAESIARMAQKLEEADSAANSEVFKEYWSRLCGD